MPDKRDLQDLPPLFLAGVITNWMGVGLLAWQADQMVIVAALLFVGTACMFFAAYHNRPKPHHRDNPGRPNDLRRQ